MRSTKKGTQTVLCGIELNTYLKAPPRCAEGLLCVLFCMMKNSWIGQKKTAPKGCLRDYLGVIGQKVLLF